MVQPGHVRASLESVRRIYADARRLGLDMVTFSCAVSAPPKTLKLANVGFWTGVWGMGYGTWDMGYGAIWFFFNIRRFGYVLCI